MAVFEQIPYLFSLTELVLKLPKIPTCARDFHDEMMMFFSVFFFYLLKRGKITPELVSQLQRQSAASGILW